MRYVGGVDSAFDVFFGEGFWLDEVCEEDDAFGPVEGQWLAGHVHDEGDHGGEVDLAGEAGEAGDDDFLGWRVDYGDQGAAPVGGVACVKPWPRSPCLGWRGFAARDSSRPRGVEKIHVSGSKTGFNNRFH